MISVELVYCWVSALGCLLVPLVDPFAVRGCDWSRLGCFRCAFVCFVLRLIFLSGCACVLLLLRFTVVVL